MNKEKTGKLIKESRIQKGLTQSQLADALGVTNKAVSRWETGNSFPDIALLSTLSEILDLSIEALVLGEQQEINTYNEIAENIVQEAKNQNETKSKKIITIILFLPVIFFLLLLLAVIFFITCFFFINNEINIEKVQLTCVFAIFAIALILYRFVLPLLGMSIPVALLNSGKVKKRSTRLFLILIILLSFIWLGISICIVLSNYFRY